MAKVIKTAAIIVGVAVAGFATAGAAWAVIGGASIGAAAASIGATAIFGSITASSIISGAALVAGIAGSFDKPSVPTVGQTDAGSQVEFKADPRAPIPYVMGRTVTGGNLIFDDTAGPKSAYLNQVIVWSGAGPVNAIEAVFANDVALGFPLDGGEGQDGFYTGAMWRRNQIGEPGSPLLVSAAVSTAGGIPSEWTDGHRLSGYAATYLVQKYDTTIYSGGPVAPKAAVQGVLCYDARYDSTYPGGYGSQRANDESTWAYTQNPYVHALTWLIGRKQNGKPLMGVGAPLSGIDIAAYVQGANVADANGWLIGGVVYSSDNKWEVLKAILQAGAGIPLKLGARISCLVSTPRVSLATLAAPDVIDEVSITAQQPKRSRINTIWPTYRQEAQNWQVAAAAAPVQVVDYFDIDGGERSREVSYALVQEANQVAQLARYDIEDAREFGPCTFPCKPRWLGYRPGDCFTANEPEWGLNGQKMLILDRQVDPSTMVVTLTCRSETDGKHAFALGQTGIAPGTPGLTGVNRLQTTPGADAFTAYPEIVAGPSGESPIIVISGGVDNPYVETIIVEYRQDFGDGTFGAWASQEFPASATRLVLSGLAPGGTYQIRIRYRMKGGASDPAMSRYLGSITIGGSVALNVKNLLDRTVVATIADLNAAAAQAADALVRAETLGRALMTGLDAFRTQGKTIELLSYEGDSTSPIKVVFRSALNVLTDANTLTATRFTYFGLLNDTSQTVILDLDKLKLSPTESFGSRLTSINTSLGANSAAITTETSNRVTAVGAVASSVSALSTTVGGHTSTLATYGSSIDGLNAKWGVAVSVGTDGHKRIGGLALNGTGEAVSFNVIADSFSISAADGSGSVSFGVSGGLTYATNLVAQTVFANSITANHIIGGAVTSTLTFQASGGSALSTSSQLNVGGAYYTSIGGQHVINVNAEIATTTSAAAGCVIRLLRDGTEIGHANKYCPGAWGGEGAAFTVLDQPGAGTFLYEVTYQATSGSGPSKNGPTSVVLTELKR